jgi:hypothetical protein
VMREKQRAWGRPSSPSRCDVRLAAASPFRSSHLLAPSNDSLVRAFFRARSFNARRHLRTNKHANMEGVIFFFLHRTPGIEDPPSYRQSCGSYGFVLRNLDTVTGNAHPVHISRGVFFSLCAFLIVLVYYLP